VTDPQGIAWEHFHTLGDIPVFRQADDVPAACCTPAPAGKPVAAPDKASARSCC
jgi:hypothetical protein